MSRPSDSQGIYNAKILLVLLIVSSSKRRSNKLPEYTYAELLFDLNLV